MRIAKTLVAVFIGIQALVAALAVILLAGSTAAMAGNRITTAEFCMVVEVFVAVHSVPVTFLLLTKKKWNLWAGFCGLPSVSVAFYIPWFLPVWAVFYCLLFLEGGPTVEEIEEEADVREMARKRVVARIQEIEGGTNHYASIRF